jgi:hypothetical protein
MFSKSNSSPATARVPPPRAFRPHRFLEKVRMKPVRSPGSRSGDRARKPFRAGRCIFCPNDVRMPKAISRTNRAPAERDTVSILPADRLGLSASTGSAIRGQVG